MGRRLAWQPRHGEDVTGKRQQITGSGGDADLFHWQCEAVGVTGAFRVIREREVRLGDTDRQLVIAVCVDLL